MARESKKVERSMAKHAKFFDELGYEPPASPLSTAPEVNPVERKPTQAQLPPAVLEHLAERRPYSQVNVSSLGMSASFDKATDRESLVLLAWRRVRRLLSNGKPSTLPHKGLSR